jgi:hypothetical protein
MVKLTCMIGNQKIFQNKISKATNMWFAAMLAEEYILIVPFAYLLQSAGRIKPDNRI